MKKQAENQIQIANDFIEGKMELTPEELFVFSHLWTMRTYENKVITSVAVLNDFIQLTKKKSDRYNKEEIQAALTSLEELNIISIEEKSKESAKTKTIVITFKELDLTGYTFVPYSKVDELNPTDFFIYVSVAKWENPKNEGKKDKKAKAEYSYSRWASLLGCDERTAIRYIKEAVEAGVIHKQKGKYQYDGKKVSKQLLQELNKYSIVPFSKKEQSTVQAAPQVESPVIAEQPEPEVTPVAPEVPKMPFVPKEQPLADSLTEIERKERLAAQLPGNTISFTIAPESNKDNSAICDIDSMLAAELSK